MGENINNKLSIDFWKDTGDYYYYQGHKVFYKESRNTNKPVLVLIHGFPNSSWDWHKLWGDLCRHFSVIAIDLLGFGFSDKPKMASYTVKSQAKLLRSFLRDKHVEHFHILSHDLGVIVTQELLASIREESSTDVEVLSVIALNSAIFPETHKPVAIQKLLLSPIGLFVAMLSSFNRYKKNFEQICAKPLNEEELKVHWRLLTREKGKRIIPQHIQYINERKQNRDRWVDVIASPICPTRVIFGVDDPVSGQHVLDRYIDIVERPDVVPLSRVGHYPQLEAPGLTLNAIYEFHLSLE